MKKAIKTPPSNPNSFNKTIKFIISRNEVNAIKIALIKFHRGSFDQEYSYFTDIEDLKEGDILVVPTSNSYSIGVFSRYSKSKLHEEKAEKWIVKNISPDIKVYEEKLFLGGFD